MYTCVLLFLWIGEFDVCASIPCKHGGTCLPEGQNFECKCPIGYSGKTCGSESFTICKIQGEPHYITFDGAEFDSQGSCRYTAVTSESPKFSVTINTKQSPIFTKRLSVLDYVQLWLDEFVYQLGPGRQFVRLKVIKN